MAMDEKLYVTRQLVERTLGRSPLLPDAAPIKGLEVSINKFYEGIGVTHDISKAITVVGPDGERYKVLSSNGKTQISSGGVKYNLPMSFEDMRKVVSQAMIEEYAPNPLATVCKAPLTDIIMTDGYMGVERRQTPRQPSS